MSDFQLSEEQTERYSRHILLPELGVEGQKKLLDSSVFVVGAGGLGSPVLMYLAAAGVGRLGLADVRRFCLGVPPVLCQMGQRRVRLPRRRASQPESQSA